MWMSNGKALLKTPMAKVIQPYEAWCQIEGDKWLAQKEQVVSEGLFQTNALGISGMSEHFWRRFQWLDHFWWVLSILSWTIHELMNYHVLWCFQLWTLEYWNPVRQQNLAFQMLQVPICFLKQSVVQYEFWTKREAMIANLRHYDAKIYICSSVMKRTPFSISNAVCAPGQIM